MKLMMSSNIRWRWRSEDNILMERIFRKNIREFDWIDFCWDLDTAIIGLDTWVTKLENDEFIHESKSEQKKLWVLDSVVNLSKRADMKVVNTTVQVGLAICRVWSYSYHVNMLLGLDRVSLIRSVLRSYVKGWSYNLQVKVIRMSKWPLKFKWIIHKNIISLHLLWLNCKITSKTYGLNNYLMYIIVPWIPTFSRGFGLSYTHLFFP